MADSKKAQLHHGKAGDCLKKGDHKGAAHHMGHALAALRMSASEGPESTDEMLAEGTEAPKSSMRDRLKKFGKNA